MHSMCPHCISHQLVSPVLWHGSSVPKPCCHITCILFLEQLLNGLQTAWDTNNIFLSDQLLSLGLQRCCEVWRNFSCLEPSFPHVLRSGSLGTLLQAGGRGCGHLPWKWRFYKQNERRDKGDIICHASCWGPNSNLHMVRVWHSLYFYPQTGLPVWLFTVLMTGDRITASGLSAFITVIIVAPYEAGTARHCTEPWIWARESRSYF